MRAVTVAALAFVLAAAPSAFSQEPPAPPAPPAAPAPAAAPRAAQAPRSAPAAPRAPAAPSPAPVPPPPVVAIDPPRVGQLLNVQLDITILVEGGAEATARKTITLTVADSQEGSVRAIDRAPNAQGTLNVDARPVVQPNGKVLTRIGLEFQSGNDVPFVQVRAQPLLEAGKPLRISRAMSPKGDRSVTVEVTATVLK